jgi:hypothetical protein
MRNSLYLLVLFALGMVWLVHQLRRTLERLATGVAGDRLLDFRFFGYDRTVVTSYFERLGPERRALYKGKHLRLELLFIIGYGIAAAGIGFWFSAVLTNAGYKWLAWLPLIGGGLVAMAAMADVDEGQRIGKLLRTWPKLSDADVARAAKATRAKWLMLLPGLVAIIAGMAMGLVVLIKNWT